MRIYKLEIFLIIFDQKNYSKNEAGNSEAFEIGALKRCIGHSFFLQLLSSQYEKLNP